MCDGLVSGGGQLVGFIVNIIMSGRAHLLHLETKKEITPINRHNVIKNLSHCLSDFLSQTRRILTLKLFFFLAIHVGCVCLTGVIESLILKYICFTVGLS